MRGGQMNQNTALKYLFLISEIIHTVLTRSSMYPVNIHSWSYKDNSVLDFVFSTPPYERTAIVERVATVVKKSLHLHQTGTDLNSLPGSTSQLRHAVYISQRVTSLTSLDTQIRHSMIDRFVCRQAAPKLRLALCPAAFLHRFHLETGWLSHTAPPKTWS